MPPSVFDNIWTQWRSICPLASESVTAPLILPRDPQKWLRKKNNKDYILRTISTKKWLLDTSTWSVYLKWVQVCVRILWYWSLCLKLMVEIHLWILCLKFVIEFIKLKFMFERCVWDVRLNCAVRAYGWSSCLKWLKWVVEVYAWGVCFKFMC